MTLPLVSVITPTWQRRDLLMGRCIPSVQAQTHRPLEHVIVSDGPDPELAAAIEDAYGHAPAVLIRFAQLPGHDPQVRWGHRARMHGAEMAWGEYLAYLDDDNAYRPGHVAALAAALDARPDAGFAYSQALFRQASGHAYLVGAAPPCFGQIDTSLIMHRRGLLDIATWRQPVPTCIDWDLVERWLAAGQTWAFVPRVTVNYYFPGAVAS